MTGRKRAQLYPGPRLTWLQYIFGDADAHSNDWLFAQNERF